MFSYLVLGHTVAETVLPCFSVWLGGSPVTGTVLSCQEDHEWLDLCSNVLMPGHGVHK